MLIFSDYLENMHVNHSMEWFVAFNNEKSPEFLTIQLIYNFYNIFNGLDHGMKMGSVQLNSGIYNREKVESWILDDVTHSARLNQESLSAFNSHYALQNDCKKNSQLQNFQIDRWKSRTIRKRNCLRRLTSSTGIFMLEKYLISTTKFNLCHSVCQEIESANEIVAKLLESWADDWMEFCSRKVGENI